LCFGWGPTLGGARNLSRYNLSMVDLVPLEPVDYLVIGHLTEDLTPSGTVLGGTAAYSALTARAFGLRVGIVTAVGQKTSLTTLKGIPLFNVPSTHTTTFENIHTPSGRTQVLHHRAEMIRPDGVPDTWRRASILHLGPVAQELPAEAADGFSPALLGLTPQGWMRTWDDDGRVTSRQWESAGTLLPKAGAVVISREDVNGDEELIEGMAHQTRVLVVTEGAAGSVLYWNGDRRRFRAPEVAEVDSVGSGDIFAAAFFIRLFTTRDPWEAARLATLLAARSVTRAGLNSIPTPKEIEECRVEVLK
jgi:sugar/nucleoside kinase (ribokinase family)